MRKLLFVMLSTFCLCSFAQELDEDEAGIWMIVEKQEQYLRTSPYRIENEHLDRFLHDISCRLAPDQCDEIRIYVLRTPGLNAFMMPNGAMFIQSGLLLRMTSTSELAAVIAHEITHYSQKHSIENIRRWNRANNTLSVIGAVVSAAGSVATLGATSYESYQSALDLSNTALLMLQTAQIFSAFQLIAYGRDDERESDMYGLELLARAGFDPLSASRVWENYLVEEEYAGTERAFSFLSTHPLPQDRMQYLKELAETREVGDAVPVELEDDIIFRFVTGEVRKEWLESEVRALHPEQMEGLIVNQEKFANLDKGYLLYLVARSWQIRAGRQGLNSWEIDEAMEKSLEMYIQASNTESNMPTEGYRDLAQVAEDMGEIDIAIEALNEYLTLAPDAWDARFVRRKIESLSI
ncbi:MAG: M48 family metalloprotease [Gammaproteobacteria bacterium]|nr:M48 family metalloprotease [Gammaproteobacteria bacterium]MYG96686.1 M48 family metalloprotease [Gammaproteobacteria bacterium]